MTRFAPFVLLLLTACQSDFAIRALPPEAPITEGDPWTAPPIGGPADPVRPSTPSGGGPWGNLNPGDLPQVYFAVAYSDYSCDDVDGDGGDPGEGDLGGGGAVGDDSDADGPVEDIEEDEPPDEDGDIWYECPARLAVIDLLGQVIAEFPLPGESDAYTAWSYLSLAPAAATRQLLEFASLARNVDHLSEEDNRMPVMTIHQAKGLEFDYVYIAGATDNELPSYYARKEGRIEEERRLFYVALTRAREAACISWHCRNDRGYATEPSRFLADLPAHCTQEGL